MVKMGVESTLKSRITPLVVIPSPAMEGTEEMGAMVVPGVRVVPAEKVALAATEQIARAMRVVQVMAEMAASEQLEVAAEMEATGATEGGEAMVAPSLSATRKTL
jgi:hypothetical protein